MDLPFEVPPGVELALDVSPASWITERLLPMDRSAGVRVGEVIPTGFDAYARVFHPGYVPDRSRDQHQAETVRWSELAERNGRTVHPEMQLEHLVGSLDIHTTGIDEPEEGRCPRPEAEALVDVLEPFASGDGCWLAIWDGYGSLGAGIAILKRFDDRRAARAHEREQRKRQRRAAKQLEAIPRFVIHGGNRAYVLLHGRIETASMLEFNHSYQSPNLWWPDDRSWCVATEVDGYSTYVGGSKACIEAILTEPRLEGLPSDPENRFDLWSDTVNPRPPGMGERSGERS